MNKKYKCPAPKCSLNKKGFCCNHCKRTKYCLEVCKNDVNKCGAEPLGGVVVDFIIDLKKDYTPYFRAFIKAMGLKDGDECKGYEFINWITGKHEEFRKSIGLDKYTPYTKKQEKIFLKFIHL